MGIVRRTWGVLADAAGGWFNDGAMSMAAAIAFYTAFSLAPIVILVTAVAGLVFGREAALGALVDQLAGLVGPEAARTVQSLAASARDERAGAWAGLLGLLTIVVGATTVSRSCRPPSTASGGPSRRRRAPSPGWSGSASRASP